MKDTPVFDVAANRAEWLQWKVLNVIFLIFGC